MTRRFSLIIVIAIVALSGFAKASEPDSQIPDTECDKQAASNLTSDKRKLGIALDKINPQTAIPACEEAVRNYPGNPRLLFELGRAYLRKAEYEKALHNFQQASDKSFPAAENAMGVIYLNGFGMPKDAMEAIKWFNKAALQADIGGQLNLGRAYYNGNGVPQDYSQALEWFRKAAEQENAEAQNMLGTLYQKGQGTIQNYVTAFYWYHKAAMQGDAYGQFNLGKMYANGQGVERDYTQAVNWYRKAAEQDNADGEDNLAYMYEYGYGVSRDYTKAMTLYRKSAAQNNMYAQTALGGMYAYGQGTQQNFVTAAQWYHKAATLGSAEAEYNLGVMCEKGEGVPMDRSQALAWYKKAADQGFEEAKKKLAGWDAETQRMALANYEAEDKAMVVQFPQYDLNMACNKGYELIIEDAQKHGIDISDPKYGSMFFKDSVVAKCLQAAPREYADFARIWQNASNHLRQECIQAVAACPYQDYGLLSMCLSKSREDSGRHWDCNQ